MPVQAAQLPNRVPCRCNCVRDGEPFNSISSLPVLTFGKGRGVWCGECAYVWQDARSTSTLPTGTDATLPDVGCCSSVRSPKSRLQSPSLLSRAYEVAVGVVMVVYLKLVVMVKKTELSR